MDVGQSGVRNSFEEPMEFDDFQKGRPLKEVSIGNLILVIHLLVLQTHARRDIVLFFLLRKILR